MECPPDVEELLQAVFALNGREIDVLMILCGEAMTVKELATKLDRDRSTVQRYLDGLRKADLIDRQQQGRKHIYRVDKAGLKEQANNQLDAWMDVKKQALDEL